MSITHLGKHSSEYILSANGKDAPEELRISITLREGEDICLRYQHGKLRVDTTTGLFTTIQVSARNKVGDDS
jgi:hypothetical protein